MKIQHLATGLFLGMTATSSALAFQFEGTGAYFDFDDRDDSALALQGQYFFAPVDDSGVPRAEAAFIRRASNVGLRYVTFDEADFDILTLGGEGYVDNLYGSVEFTRNEFGSLESDDLALELGFFLSDTTRLSVGYDDDESFAGGSTSRISLNGKMLNLLGNGQAFNGEFSIGQSDDANDTVDYSLRGDFFLNADFSLGLEYADSDDDTANDSLDFNARWFVIPTLSVQITYHSEDMDDFIQFGVTGRF